MLCAISGLKNLLQDEKWMKEDVDKALKILCAFENKTRGLANHQP